MAESEQVAPAALSVLERTVKFKWFEEACIELARGIMEKALQELDDALLVYKPKGYKVAGFRTRVLGSRVGDVRIRRRLYVKATKPNGKREKGRFLLDECLNLHSRRRMTEGLARLAISLALRLPFREVEAVLCEAGMSSLSHGTIHQEVRRYGEELAKLQERIALGQACEGEVKRRKVPVIFLEVDGVMVRRQRSKRRRLEIKVGVGYEGWEEIGPDGKIRRLVRPWVFAGAYESVGAFWPWRVQGKRDYCRLCAAKKHGRPGSDALRTNVLAPRSLFREVSTYFPLTGTPHLPALPKVQMSDNLNTGHLNQPFTPPVGKYWLVLPYRS